MGTSTVFLCRSRSENLTHEIVQLGKGFNSKLSELTLTSFPASNSPPYNINSLSIILYSICPSKLQIIFSYSIDVPISLANFYLLALKTHWV